MAREHRPEKVLGGRADGRLDAQVAAADRDRRDDELGVDQLGQPGGDQLEQGGELGLACHGVADLGQGLELREPARRRLVQARVLDRDRRLRGQQRDELLVLAREVLAAPLLGQVQVAVGDAAEQDRHAEERAHWGVVGRKADGARIGRQVVEPECVRVPNQHPEDPAAVRKVADAFLRLRVDARGQEALERAAGWIDHAERRVPRPRQLRRGVDDSLQEGIERELRRDRDPGVDQPAPAGLHCGELWS